MSLKNGLDENRFYTLKGYLSLLETAPPNGGPAHDAKNFIMALRLCIRLQKDISPEYERRIKKTINRLYFHQQF